MAAQSVQVPCHHGDVFVRTMRGLHRRHLWIAHDRHQPPGRAEGLRRHGARRQHDCRRPRTRPAAAHLVGTHPAPGTDPRRGVVQAAGAPPRAHGLRPLAAGPHAARVQRRRGCPCTAAGRAEPLCRTAGRPCDRTLQPRAHPARLRAAASAGQPGRARRRFTHDRCPHPRAPGGCRAGAEPRGRPGTGVRRASTAASGGVRRG